MNIRKQLRQRVDLQAEWYHRTKLEALRAEGERLRHELRRRGLDPAVVLRQEQQARNYGTQN